MTQDISATRRRRFAYGIVTSLGSKTMAVWVQFVALPFALHSLGTDRYASFLALQSLLSWTGLCGMGLSLSLPRFIAAAGASGDHHEERNLIVTALVVLGSVVVVLFVLLNLVGLFVSPAAMVAASKSVSSKELSTAYFAAVALSALQLFTNIEVSIRSGYQEYHRASICAIGASIGVLIGLFYFGAHSISIAGFIAIVYGPLVVLLLADLGLLFYQRPYLCKGSVELFRTARSIAAPSGNALFFQIGVALLIYLPTLVVAHLDSANATAGFGTLLQLVVLGASSLNLLFQPLNSAMANAHSHGDTKWIERNYCRVFFMIGILGTLSCAVAGVVGPLLIDLWLGYSMGISAATLVSFGVFFLLLSNSLFHFYVLSAVGGLRGVGALYLSQGIIGLSLGALFCATYGATGMALGLAAGIASTSWALPSKVMQVIKSGEKTPQNLSSRSCDLF